MLNTFNRPRGSTELGIKTLYASEYGAKTGANITAALQRLSVDANLLKKNFRIVIDVGDAEIFDQTINPSPKSTSPYYIPAGGTGNLIELTDCSNFTIDFTGATLTTKPGLHFGSFDPLTGAVYNTQNTLSQYVAHIGRVVYLTRCKSYQILNLTADGNMDNIVLGGGWGDKDYQCTHTGTSENNCFSGTSINTKCNNFGLDGTYIGGSSQGSGSGITHIQPECQYCGRQGLSVTGSDNITLINPNYSFTARGKISSSPRAGIDIEPNGNYYSVGIKIINPKFINNMGAGILAIRGRNISVEGGEIVSDGSAFYCDENISEVTLTNVNLYGSVRIAKGKRNVFNECYISDEAIYGIQPASTTKLIENLGVNAIFRNCTVYSGLDKVYIENGKFFNTNFIIHADAPAARSRAILFKPTVARDVAITQSYTNQSAAAVSGEYTYADCGTVTSKTWQGDCYLSGDALAFSGRSGQLNCLITTAKPNGIYNTSVTTVSPIINADTTIDIPLGVGFRKLGITLSGYSDVRFLVEQCSFASSAATRHQSKLVTFITNGLAGTITAAIAIVDGNDVIRLTGCTSDLSAAIATITSDKFVNDNTLMTY